MAQLLILVGERAGERVPLDREVVTIGRDPGCEVSVPMSLAVSRRHARLVRVEGKWHLEDLQTRGRTRLNHGVQIHERTMLADNDEIGIGDFAAVFMDGDDGALRPDLVARICISPGLPEQALRRLAEMDSSEEVRAAAQRVLGRYFCQHGES